MPIPKGFIVVHGERIIDRNIRLLRTLFGRIFLSTNEPERYFYTGAILVGDVMHQKGPMTGIYSVLSSPGVAEVFVTACDMPFINVILIQFLIENWRRGIDALIPVYRNRPEPLFGIYSRSIADAMAGSISRGERSLQNFLGNIDVLYINENEVRKRDPEGKSFVNINTLEDYQRETGGTECLV